MVAGALLQTDGGWRETFDGPDMAGWNVSAAFVLARDGERTTPTTVDAVARRIDEDRRLVYLVNRGTNQTVDCQITIVSLRPKGKPVQLAVAATDLYTGQTMALDPAERWSSASARIGPGEGQFWVLTLAQAGK